MTPEYEKMLYKRVLKVIRHMAYIAACIISVVALLNLFKGTGAAPYATVMACASCVGAIIIDRVVSKVLGTFDARPSVGMSGRQETSSPPDDGRPPSELHRKD